MTYRATIQIFIILIGISFELMGTGYGHFNAFPLSEYQESIRGYVYHNCEHLKFIAIVLLMWRFPARAADFKTDGMFVMLAVFDFVDYLLTGNSIWFGIGTKPMFPVSMNMISIVIFTLYAHNQWKMNTGHRLH